MTHYQPSQERRILMHLEAGGTITQLYAAQKFNCYRLGARIWALKQAGHEIVSKMVTKGRKRFAEYSLA